MLVVIASAYDKKVYLTAINPQDSSVSVCDFMLAGGG